MNSAIDIAIPDLPITLSRDTPAAEVDEIFQRLRELKSNLGKPTNADNRLTAMIAACIDEGINTSPRIFGTARQLGFDLGHTRRVLRSGIGHTWNRAADDRFSNLI
ncbi:hypothetical protein [Sphingopyxis sp. JAI108]|uniref:hypothetical protein n=1 Tax=Sphingopyxis sp. JAI108 TaxID=2723060 RepID=UPI0015CCF945|nr:hypothetical protein [Sphingopyxis sp. JAI108]NYF33807.1 hypothetical protein [Sphingopyxis sp. JAI108]